MQISKRVAFALALGAALAMCAALWCRSPMLLLLAPVFALVLEDVDVALMGGDSMFQRAFNAIARRFVR